MVWLKKKLTGLSYRYLRGTVSWAHTKSPEIRPERLLWHANYTATRLVSAFTSGNQGFRFLHNLNSHPVLVLVASGDSRV